MTKPWSKLKARVEALWDPALPLAIHCTAYANSRSRRGESRLSRHWLLLGKEMFWNFPGDFVEKAPPRGRQAPHCGQDWPNGHHHVGELLRLYLDRPVAQLSEPFEDDGWELTDILRAAGRRLGRQALQEWGEGLDEGHPAHRVLAVRWPVGKPT